MSNRKILFKNRFGEYVPYNKEDELLKQWCFRYNKKLRECREFVRLHETRTTSPIQRNLLNYYTTIKGDRLLKKWCRLRNKAIKPTNRNKEKTGDEIMSNIEIENIKGTLSPLPASSRSKLTFYNNVDKIEVVTSKGSPLGVAALANIQRVSKDSYVNKSTGEVLNYQKKENRVDNIASVRNSIHNIRRLILNNFTPFEGFHITLTYDSPTFDFNVAANDFVKFYEKFKYHYRNYKFEYLRIIEPHESGAWHIHVVLKSAMSDPQMCISNEVVASIWKLGSVKVTQITNIEGLACYLGTYCNQHSSENIGSKTITKQERWKYYPTGVRIFTKSRGIKYPETLITTHRDAKSFLGDYDSVSQNTSLVKDKESGMLVNVVNYENFEKRNQ